MKPLKWIRLFVFFMFAGHLIPAQNDCGFDVDFSYNNDVEGCYIVLFSNNTTGIDTADAAYLWDFGDGTTNDDYFVNGGHTYEGSGIYTVQLTVTDTTADPACSEIISKEVEVGCPDDPPPDEPPLSCADSCEQDTLSLNSGLDYQADTVYGAKTRNSYWTLTNAPEDATSGSVTIPSPAWNINKASAWDTYNSSRWMSAFNKSSFGQNNKGNENPYSYKRCFCQCSGGSIELDFDVMSDDIASVYLETPSGELLLGEPPASPDYFMYKQNYQIEVDTSISGDAGQYCVRVDGRNTSSFAMGVAVQGTVSGLNLINDLCCNPNGSICGAVYIDKGCDGNRNSELIYGYENRTVSLYNDNGEEIRTQETDAKGYYCFTDLPPGNYEVVHQNPEGYEYSTTTSGSINVDLGLNEVSNQDFGICLDFNIGAECFLWEENQFKWGITNNYTEDVEIALKYDDEDNAVYKTFTVAAGTSGDDNCAYYTSSFPGQHVPETAYFYFVDQSGNLLKVREAETPRTPCGTFDNFNAVPQCFLRQENTFRWQLTNTADRDANIVIRYHEDSETPLHQLTIPANTTESDQYFVELPVPDDQSLPLTHFYIDVLGTLYQAAASQQPVTEACDGGPEYNCEECISSFSPIPGEKYVLSAWVKETNMTGATDYDNSGIFIDFTGYDKIGPFKPEGQIIDGWQRIESAFTMPEGVSDIIIELENLDARGEVYFDDVRIHPFNSNMKSFVYDPVSQRLVAELDENNYATFYEYDEEGALIRVKKETERGIKTIQESRNSNKKRKNEPINK